jgi:hypothetical protein
VQAVSVEGDGLAAMHVAADDRLHQQPVAESIHRPYQSRGRHGTMPHGIRGRNGRNMDASMYDEHPRHGHAAGRMSRTSHAMLKDNASLPGTRPGNDHAVSRCSGSEAGAGIAQRIGRYMETEQRARIQPPSLANVDQLTGASRTPLTEVVCPCNVGDPSGIRCDIGRDAVNRDMERWRPVSLTVCQDPHGHHDHGRGYDEADDARHHRGGGADSSFRCTAHSQESG